MSSRTMECPSSASTEGRERRVRELSSPTSAQPAAFRLGRPPTAPIPTTGGQDIDAVVAELEDKTNRTAMFADQVPPGTIFPSNINDRDELIDIFGDSTSSDPIAAARAPNVFIQPNWGVIYSGSSKKIAEHGGGTLDDTKAVRKEDTHVLPGLKL
jgi:hypothetical protein